MNIELKEKYKSIHDEFINVRHTLNELEYFFEKTGRQYNKTESIQALKKIKEYTNNLYKKYDELNLEMRKAKYDFQKSCEHKIVIKHPMGRTCACCAGPVFNDKYNPEYEIEIPFDTHLVGYESLMDDKSMRVVDYIYDSVDKNLFNEEELEESFEYLQDNSKAIVRKLK